MKIGLALSAGSARGLSHIGVLKVFEKHEIPIDYLSGTSMGAIIASLYALGYNAEAIEDLILTTNWDSLVDFTLPSLGLIKGKKIESQLKKLLHKKTFKDMRIPLRIIGTDLTARREVVFKSGDVSKAVRASISLPFYFKPVKINNHFIVDGGMVNPVPIDQLKKMGADYIIATDITSKARKQTMEGKTHEKNLYDNLKQKFVFDETKLIKNIINDPAKHLINKPIDWLLNLFLTPKRILKYMNKGRTPPIFKVATLSMGISINQIALNTLKDKDIDLIIKPKLNMAWTDFDRAEYAIKQGEKAAKAIIPELKRKL